MESIPEERSPILVVDDDTGMLSSIEATLCSCGMPRPALVSDSRRVMPLIRNHGFQVVLLDIIMPHMNGIDVLKKIKAEFPDTQCVMISAVDKTEKIIEAVKSGAFDYLVKPIGREKLQNVVNAAIQRATQGIRNCHGNA